MKLPATTFVGMLLLLGTASTAAEDVLKPGAAKTQSDQGTIEQPGDADCFLQLEFPERISRQPPKATVRLTNNSMTTVTMVVPGDGSDCGWRTPVVGWSILPAESNKTHPTVSPRRRGGRCGNINRLTAKDVFTLKPGETRVFTEWLGVPRNLTPGKYRAVFYYSNIPHQKWSGIPLGDHDEAAMLAVRNSTPVALISNEVRFDVIESQ